MERLSLHEEDEFEFGNDGEEATERVQSLCLVGRFLSDRSIRFPSMRDRMAEVWRPGRGVSIKEIEPGLFAFQFYHPLDVQKVIKMGPWSFDKHMLVLGVVPEGVERQVIPLNHIPFWVQVHDLPPGLMSETVGKGLANFIGQFLEYDSHNSPNFWRTYMRIRVLVDITQPLKRTKKVRRQGGEARMVKFRYERLETFCYVCGKIGHGEGSCEELFARGRDDGVRGWGPELRAEIRRNGASSRSRWLRDENDDQWVSPTQALNAGRNPGHDWRGNYGANNDNNAQNSRGVNRGESGAGNGSKGINGGAASSELVKGFNLAAFYQDPQSFFKVKNSVLVKETCGTANDEDVSDDVMVIEKDRKRQRSKEGNEGLVNGGSNNTTIGGTNNIINDNDNNVTTKTTLEAENNSEGMRVEEVVSPAINNQSFLWAGPGGQACQEQ